MQSGMAVYTCTHLYAVLGVHVYTYMQSCWLYTCTRPTPRPLCSLSVHVRNRISATFSQTSPHSTAPSTIFSSFTFSFFQIFSAFGIIKNAQLRISWPKLPMIPVITMHYWQYSKYWKLQKCVIRENSVRHTKPHPHTVCTRYIWLGRKH